MKRTAAILGFLFCCGLMIGEVQAQNVLIRIGQDGSLIIQEKASARPQQILPLSSSRAYDLVISKGKMLVLKNPSSAYAQRSPARLMFRPKVTSANNTILLSPSKTSADWSDLIKKYAKENGIDARLVQLVVEHESGGNPQAISPKGARGLMQLMPCTASMLGVNDPFDPEQNIAGGIKFLKHCLNRFNNDVSLALAAYNAGPENVNRYQGVPPFNETRNYVANIMRDYTGQTPSFQKALFNVPPPTTLPSPYGAADDRKSSAPPHSLGNLQHLILGGSNAGRISQVGKLKIIDVSNE